MESKEYQDQHKQEIHKYEQEQLKAYNNLVRKAGKLRRFFTRNRVWFTPETCTKVDELLETQDKFIEWSDPTDRLLYQAIAGLADTVSEATDEMVEALEKIRVNQRSSRQRSSRRHPPLKRLNVRTG